MISRNVEMLAAMIAFMVVPGLAKQDNFCKPLEDYGPREDAMEIRHVCNTEMKKSCQPVKETGCLNVTELRCSVRLTTNCSMDWQNKDRIQSVMSVTEKNLKNCTKEMVKEYHNKTIYDCRNVTKVHCTTLWTIDETGQKIWAGNEDDCRDVTWEECFPISKQVPMLVAEMRCRDVPVSYFDYENATTQVMADTMDCKVEAIPVCEPVVTTMCDEVTYTRCEEVPDTVCSTVEIPVPSQQTLHKQWCLFDQEENIDFDRQVRIITERQQSAGNLTDELPLDNERSSLSETDRSSLSGVENSLPISSEFDPIFVDFSSEDTVGITLDVRDDRDIYPAQRKANKQKRFAKSVKLVRRRKPTNLKPKRSAY